MDGCKGAQAEPLGHAILSADKAKAIALLNLQREHLGFMLIAGIPDAYQQKVGHWEGSCVFLMTPRESHILDDPVYMTLVEHKVQDEHLLTIANDGATLLFEALSHAGSILYIKIPITGLRNEGIWSIRGDTREE